MLCQMPRSKPGSVSAIVGISGASGSLYGYMVLQALRAIGGIETHLVLTSAARRTIELETDMSADDFEGLADVAHRDDDALIDSLAAQGIAYVPYFPLGGFSPLQSGTLDSIAARLGSTPMSVALAWLLQRSPNILLIPGTSSVAHLHENVAGAALTLPEDALSELESIAT